MNNSQKRSPGSVPGRQIKQRSTVEVDALKKKGSRSLVQDNALNKVKMVMVAPKDISKTNQKVFHGLDTNSRIYSEIKELGGINGPLS